MEGKTLNDARAAQHSSCGLPALSKFPSSSTPKASTAFSAPAHAIPMQTPSGQQVLRGGQHFSIFFSLFPFLFQFFLHLHLQGPFAMPK